MRSFEEFIKDTERTENLGLDESTKYFRINESGIVDGFEEDVIGDLKKTVNWQDFPELFDTGLDESDDDSYEDEDSYEDDEDDDGVEEYGNPGTTFGNEVIVDLDVGDVVSEAKKKSRREGSGEKDVGVNDTETIQYLMGRGGRGDGYKHSVRSMDDVKNMAYQFVVDPSDGIPKDGQKLVITRKKYNEPDEKRHPLTDEEIAEIIKNRNKPAPKPAEFSINDNGELLKNGKYVQRNHKIGFLKHLNTFIELYKEKVGDGMLRHYSWEKVGEIKKYDDGKHVGQEMKGSNLGNRLMYNASDYDNSDKSDLKRYSTVDYLPIAKDSTQAMELLGYIQTFQHIVAEQDKDVLGWNSKIGTFTINGKPLIGNDLIEFINARNAYMSDDRTADWYEFDKKGNSIHKKGGSGTYWQHFKISMSGSKVGDVANFSLPPVITCNKDAPCIHDGCYAIKAYGMYPTTRISQEVNLRLLNDGKYDQLIDEISAVLRYKRKGSNTGFKYFRFFVSGDLPSYEMLNTICQIARNNKKVKFWMYTKQYKMLKDYRKEIPGNLTILVSCWGQFCPKFYVEGGKYIDPESGKLGPYAELETRFPLAYLDDGTENTHKYFNKKEGDMICPCTEDDEVVARCDSCHLCFEASANNGNIIFKKH